MGWDGLRQDGIGFNGMGWDGIGYDRITLGSKEFNMSTHFPPCGNTSKPSLREICLTFAQGLGFWPSVFITQVTIIKDMAQVWPISRSHVQVISLPTFLRNNNLSPLCLILEFSECFHMPVLCISHDSIMRVMLPFSVGRQEIDLKPSLSPLEIISGLSKVPQQTNLRTRIQTQFLCLQVRLVSESSTDATLRLSWEMSHRLPCF